MIKVFVLKVKPQHIEYFSALMALQIRTLHRLFVIGILTVCLNSVYGRIDSSLIIHTPTRQQLAVGQRSDTFLKNQPLSYKESQSTVNAATAKPLKIPFRYVNGFLLVDIVINKRLPLSFIFDTGSKHTILTDADFIPFLGQLPEEEIQLVGSDLTVPITGRIMRRTSLNVGEVDLENQSLILLDGNILNLNILTGEPIHGILGVGAFGAYGLKIDYESGKIELFEPEAIRPKKKSTIIPIRVEQSKAYLDVETNILPGRTQKLSLLIDTGASLSMLIHTSQSDTSLFPKKLVTGTFGYGLGGYLVGYVGRSDVVKLGPYALQNIITHFQIAPDSSSFERLTSREGILGNGILDRFSVLIDFTRGELHLQQVKKSKKKLTYDRSGMRLVRDGAKLNKIRIQHISEGSPADRSGILSGDELIKVGRLPITLRTLSGIENSLRGKVGKKIRLSVKRNDQILVKSIVLKELI